MHKKISSLVALMFFIFLSSCFASAAFGGAIEYSLADIEGTWEVNSLASGPGAPWWERATITIASDGTFTGNTADSDGYSGPKSGRFNISSEGIVTLEGDASFMCSMGSSKTVFAGTGTWTTGSPGTTEMKVFTKKAVSYSPADMTGKWNFNALASGPGAPFWDRGTITIAADGSCFGKGTINDGSSDTFSGTCSISSDGIVTLSSVNPSARCVMDASKSVFTCSSTWQDGSGTTDMGIGTKKAASYSQADLIGTWNFNGLTSGPGAPYWDRGFITVNANGSCFVTVTDSKGSSDSLSATCSISSGGTVTLSFTNPNNKCTMDESKAVFACTSTWKDNSTHMAIALKSGPSISLTSPNGGEVVPSGSKLNITWTAFPPMVKFTLKYSVDNGATWQKIASDVTNNNYDWTVPEPAGNKSKCLMQVIGYDGNNKKVGSDKSDTPFTIEVVRLTSPNGGEYLLSGSLHTITWTTNPTQKDVAKVKLLYTGNGGASWNVIENISGNPGSYDWTVPCVLQTTANCKVKVVLMDALGNSLGKDASDNNFTLAHAWTDISGYWDVYDSGNIICKFSDGSSESSPIAGSGSASINQSGPNISWIVPGTDVSRSGSVCGNTLKFTGKLCVAAVSGVSFTENKYTGSGIISGDYIDGNGHGRCAGSYLGITFTCTVNDTFTFTKYIYGSQDTKIAVGEQGKLLMHNSFKVCPATCP